MNKENRGKGKSKKIMVCVATVVAAAAIAVPTALTLAGGNKGDADANHSRKYNIIVSNGIENAPDYSLTIDEGTKIRELKTILKAIDGYKIDGVYKDEAMQHEYSDNETITSSTKIFIKFVALTYTVNVYNEDGTSLIETQEVSYKEGIILAEPSKEEDNFATYEFLGWINERGEIVNLNSITSDLNIRPSFKANMKDYRIGFVNSTSTNSISVSVGGVPVTLNSTYHYGSTIKLRAYPQAGFKVTEFKVKVGNGETVDLFTEENRHEENGVAYYEAEVIGNGDLGITYNEAPAEYSLGEIPEGVTVIRNGEELTDNAILTYGDLIKITYEIPENYTLSSFQVSGAEYVQGADRTYKVLGNVEINLETKYKYSYLTFEKVSDGYSITAFDGTVNEVEIPNEYKGEAITEIANNVFENASITKLTIGKNIKTIGKEAFKGCTKLAEINYNAIEASDMLNLETGEFFNAFLFVGNNTNGTIINIGEGVKKIPAGMFSTFYENIQSEEDAMKLSKITEVNIAESVTEIGMGAFAYCVNLIKVNIPKEIKIIDEFTFGYCLNINSIELPEGLTTIGGSAFSNTGLTEIVIPNSVTTIGDSAFYGCTNLTSIILPEGLTKIKRETFNGCSNLTSIIIPSTVTNIEYRAFNNCENLTSVTIKSDVSIADYAFNSSHKNLNSITIENLEFYKKVELNSYFAGTLFDGVKEIRVLESACDWTNNKLNEYETTIDGDYIVFNLQKKAEHEYLTFKACEGGYSVSGFNKNSGITEVVIPEIFNNIKIVRIEGHVFSGCSNITSITIPDSVTSMGNNAFYDCDSLESIEIPSSVTSIGSYAFADCNNLKMVKLSSNITRLEEGVFWNCVSLTSIEIPSGVTYIGDSAFSGCSSLTSINIPDGVTNIADYVFKCCNNLESIEIPSGVTNIGSSAFSECYKLKSIEIPEGVTSIGSYAFSSCPLISINFPESLTYIGGSAFSNVSRDLYTSDEYADYLGDEKNPYLILISFNSKDITTYNINEKCKFIDGYVFSGCKNLTSVTLPEGLLCIGEAAFQSCSNLSSIKIPESVTVIGGYAFNGCNSLTSITIPSKVTTIGNQAFNGCNITSIIIPNSVTRIGYKVFDKCTNLTSIIFENTNGWKFLDSSNIIDVSDPSNNIEILKNNSTHLIREEN